MTTKLFVVTKATSGRNACLQAKEFIEGTKSLFHTYSIVKCISQSNGEFENLGFKNLSLEENKDFWFENYNKKDNLCNLSFEEWLKEKKCLLQDFSTFEEIKTYSIVIASQHLIYGDVCDYINKLTIKKSNLVTKDSFLTLFRNLKNNFYYFLCKYFYKKKKITDIDLVKKINKINDIDYFDYQFCYEYFLIMDTLSNFGTINPSEFNLLEHSFFPGYFGLDQIAHYNYDKYSNQNSPDTTWVVLVDISW